MESTTGSMGGESNNNGAACVICVKEEGTGKYMCCGQAGAKGGTRFSTTFPMNCKFKNHDKKANVRPNHIYLGNDPGK